MLGGEWPDSDILTKGNTGFVYALACPYNVMGNFGWPEIAGMPADSLASLMLQGCHAGCPVIEVDP